MAGTHAATPYPHQELADRAAPLPATASFAWLAQGLADFRRAFRVSFAYGMVFVLAGVLLALAAAATNMIYLLVPLATGFLLVGPAATLGFYAISRDLADGEQPTLRGALLAYRANPGPILYVGGALLGILGVWLRLEQLTYALAFQDTMGMDLRSQFFAILHTADGLAFLASSVAMGAVMAALVFAAAAFALPMLLDKPVGMVDAVATSWAAVRRNLAAMAVWAALLVALTVIGMLAGFVGLAVTLPIAGHATWHAYREVCGQ